MESAFSEDFSGLSVSLGAASRLDTIDASAATDGSWLSFASTNPDEEEVAHELAHVVQRRREGGDASEWLSQEGDQAEQGPISWRRGSPAEARP